MTDTTREDRLAAANLCANPIDDSPRGRHVQRWIDSADVEIGVPLQVAAQAFRDHRLAAERAERERIVAYLRGAFPNSRVCHTALRDIATGEHRKVAV